MKLLISQTAEGNCRDPSESTEQKLKWIIFNNGHCGRCPTVTPSFFRDESGEHSQYEMSPEEVLEKSVERVLSKW